ncbi:MAG: dihydroxyacetone kinase subunit DhaL [Candidatus Sumerlaeota bacterium]|nr:dihydroxyacetone kinase subunit DhaL [Candidatus Sumerlaeota bacterium]
MPQAISREDVIRMIQCAAAKIRANHEALSKLDSAIGDGDHGTSMMRAADAAEKSAKESAGSDLKAMLQDVGWAVMGIDGGSTGPLLGSFFMGMSDGAADGDAPLNADAVAWLFQAGLEGIRQQTKAQPGDKTLMDALVPAVETFRANAAPDADVAAIMAEAAEAANAGVEATKAMQAKFGRARNLKERTIGHADPGATSLALIFQGFAEALNRK